VENRAPRADVRVRAATISDLAAIASISLAAGQPPADSGADPRYATLLLDHGSVRVAVRPDGAVAGWGATWPTPAGEMLSDLFVDPGRHGRGVGGRLLRALWPGGPQTPARLTFSSRHPSALPLYARAGLAPRWPLLYLTGDPRDLPVPPAVRATPVSAERAAEADAGLTAAGRRDADYRYWSAAGGSGVLVHAGARLVAAGAGRRGELSHLTCPDADQAAAALMAALVPFGDTDVTVHLPGPHPALGDLLRHGWRVEDYDLAMSTPDVRLSPNWAYAPGLA
jgi:GNAT superfamily N-acetyltransferase